MKKAYVSCPYTLGNTCLNIRKAIQVANTLMVAGYAPYVPVLNHLWDLITPKSYKEWLKLDLEWLKVCDLVIRVKGKSKGADLEVKTARKLKIPVKYI
jgi:hypothetical protein